MEHTTNVFNGLKHYFNVLETVGSYDKSDMEGLIIYAFIVNEIFQGPLYNYLDDEGLDAFNKALSCLYRKGCLFDNPNLIKLSKPHGADPSRIWRISQQDAIRTTTNNTPDVRRIEQQKF